MAVIGTPRLNVGMLQYQVRDIIARIASYSTEFGTWAAPATVRTGVSEAHRPGGRGPDEAARELPPTLPARRRTAQ